MSRLRVSIRGVGLLGPGLPSWAAALPVLRGEAAWVESAPTLAAPARLQPAERRRAGPTIRVAMAVADAAVAEAGVDPASLATVFAASGGEGTNCHVLCETLAGPDRQLSPTRFTNSVHNAAAGYWHIAVGSRASSTSLSAYDGSFSAGLIEAATQVGASGAPVLLVACDVPYPEPLHSLRPLPHPMGVALLLGPAGTEGALAELGIELVEAGRAGAPARCADAGLETLRPQIPAAAALPLLEALARHAPAEALVLDGLSMSKLRLSVAFPGARP
jgi:hypothetical protein